MSNKKKKMRLRQILLFGVDVPKFLATRRYQKSKREKLKEVMLKLKEFSKVRNLKEKEEI